MGESGSIASELNFGWSGHQYRNLVSHVLAELQIFDLDLLEMLLRAEPFEEGSPGKVRNVVSWRITFDCQRLDVWGIELCKKLADPALCCYLRLQVGFGHDQFKLLRRQVDLFIQLIVKLFRFFGDVGRIFLVGSASRLEVFEGLGEARYLGPEIFRCLIVNVVHNQFDLLGFPSRVLPCLKLLQSCIEINKQVGSDVGLESFHRVVHFFQDVAQFMAGLITVVFVSFSIRSLRLAVVDNF